MDNTKPTFTPGGGTWKDCKSVACGKINCVTGPCICFTQGTGIGSCIGSAFLFPFVCLLGSVMGIYNWFMCNACFENARSEEYVLQSEKLKCCVPCGSQWFSDDFTFLHCLAGQCVGKSGPCMCLSTGNGFCACLMGACCFPFACITGAILGCFNWLTCGSCTTKLDESPMANLIAIV